MKPRHFAMLIAITILAFLISYYLTGCLIPPVWQSFLLWTGGGVLSVILIKHFARMNAVTFFVLTISYYLTGCFITPGWQSFLLRTAGSVLTTSLTNIATQELTGNRVDYGHSLADSLYRNASLTVNGNELYDLLKADTGGKLPETTKATVQAFERAVAVTQKDSSTPQSRAKARAKAADALAKTITEITNKAGGLRHD